MKIEQIENIVTDKGAKDLIGFKLIDFLPKIEKTFKDASILRHWSSFFDGLRVPYVVQDTGNTFVLWKKQEAITD